MRSRAGDAGLDDHRLSLILGLLSRGPVRSVMPALLQRLGGIGRDAVIRAALDAFSISVAAPAEHCGVDSTMPVPPSIPAPLTVTRLALIGDGSRVGLLGYFPVKKSAPK
jgi:hypothetical protein